MLIADLHTPLDYRVLWLAGMAQPLGIPVLGWCGPQEHPERLVSPLKWGAVSIVDSFGELKMNSARLLTAIRSGMSQYAEAATELHVKFLERVDGERV